MEETVTRRTWKFWDLAAINAYWLGLNVASGIITPLLLPYLVLQFMPPEQKNTYLAIVRSTGLAVAMLVQPLAGMLSDRGWRLLNTQRWGRRRPFIVVGTLFDILFLVIVGASPAFADSQLNAFFRDTLGVSAAYAVLMAGIVLLQVSSNVAHAAVQGLIPDLVPQERRGMASGIKAIFELLPVFLVLFVGPLVDAGRVALTVSIVAASFLMTMLITVLFVEERPWPPRHGEGRGWEAVLRIVALTVIFVAMTQAAIWLVRATGNAVTARAVSTATQVAVVGLAGLVGMAGAIFVGVYAGARVGIGRGARQQSSFIWWVVNRLLFLAAVGSIQSFAQYYLQDVMHIENAATMTTVLLAAVALFLIPSALGGGYLADRVGRKRLVALAGLVAAGGTVLLLFAQGIPLVIVSGCIIGLGAGTFMATNWALGTDLVPPEDAGRYLGISNLAGAGAGIVGAGIGGPLADFFNALRPGLGYLVIFALYAVLFLLSALTLTQVKRAGE